MDNILILGSAGFTGRCLQNYIVRHGLQEDFCFIGVDFEESSYGAIEGVASDVFKKTELERILRLYKPAYIINLVGLFHSENASEIMAANAYFTRDLCESLIKLGVRPKKILLIGSAAEYGVCSKLPITEEVFLNPVNQYGLSKVFQSVFAKYYRTNFDLPISMARTFNITGPDMSTKLSIGSWVEQIRHIDVKGVLRTGNLDTKRDFTDIDDVVEAYWRIVMHEGNEFVFNVCSGTSIALRDMAEFMIEASGKEIALQQDLTRMQSGDIPDSFGSYTKLQSLTGWTPQRNVFDGIRVAITRDTAL